MKRLLLPLLASLALPTAVNAEIPDSLHKKCLEAQDYAGCVKTNKEKLYKKKFGNKEKYYIEIDKADKRCEKFKEISYSQFIEKLDKNLIKGYLYFGGYTKRNKYGEILEPDEIKSNLIQINTWRGNYVLRDYRDAEKLLRNSKIINLHAAIHERINEQEAWLIDNINYFGIELDDDYFYRSEFFEIVCR